MGKISVEFMMEGQIKKKCRQRTASMFWVSQYTTQLRLPSLTKEKAGKIMLTK